MYMLIKINISINMYARVIFKTPITLEWNRVWLWFRYHSITMTCIPWFFSTVLNHALKNNTIYKSKFLFAAVWEIGNYVSQSFERVQRGTQLFNAVHRVGCPYFFLKGIARLANMNDGLSLFSSETMLPLVLLSSPHPPHPNMA